jgi:hypothetical protein
MLVRPLLLVDPPLIWNDSHHVQWGEDPEPIEANSELIRWLRGIDGTRTLDAVLRNAPQPVTQAEKLLNVGYRCGDLADASAVPSRWYWGDDDDRRACQRLTRVLLRASGGALGIHQVNRILDERGRIHVDIDDPHRHLPGLPDAVLATGLRTTPRAGVTERTVLVRVVCAHPDLFHGEEGPLALEAPHLHVGVGPDTSLIGPLVLPGETSCLRCAHLHHRDRDPHWPVRSVQWAHRRTCALAPTELTGWVTYVTSRLLADWCDAGLGHRPDTTWRNTALRLTRGADAPIREERPVHPLCGCSWGRPG